MALFQDSPLAFLLSTAILLITTSSFLALSISLHSAYLWLAVVFVALIFLATFTCTYSLPGYFIQDTPPAIDNQADPSRQNDSNSPYWIAVDMPPTYEVAVGLLPPSYSKATSAMLKLDVKEAPVHSAAAPVIPHTEATAAY